MRKNRQTDITKLLVAFQSIASAPKMASDRKRLMWYKKFSEFGVSLEADIGVDLSGTLKKKQTKTNVEWGCHAIDGRAQGGSPHFYIRTAGGIPILNFSCGRSSCAAKLSRRLPFWKRRLMGRSRKLTYCCFLSTFDTAAQRGPWTPHAWGF